MSLRSHPLYLKHINKTAAHENSNCTESQSQIALSLFFLQVQWGKSSVFIRHTYEKASAGSRLCWRLLLSPPTVFIRHTYEKASAGSRLCWRLLLSPPTHMQKGLCGPAHIRKGLCGLEALLKAFALLEAFAIGVVRIRQQEVHSCWIKNKGGCGWALFFVLPE